MNTTLFTNGPASNVDSTWIAPPSGIATVVLRAADQLRDQVLVPQARCVDILLDLYLATDDIGLKWSIAERINDLKGRKTVRVTTFGLTRSVRKGVAQPRGELANQSEPWGSRALTLQYFDERSY